MKTAGVAELKTRLSAYLRQVKAGAEVLVTERGLPIAKLMPLNPGDRRGARRERLARAGLLRMGRGLLRKSLLAPPRGAVAGEPAKRAALGEGVLAALLEERGEGR